MTLLTDKDFATVLNLNDIIHIVDVDDLTASPFGTSKKATLSQIKDIVDTTGGIYSGTGSGNVPTNAIATLTDTFSFEGGQVIIKGSGTGSGTKTLLLKDSSGEEVFRALDNKTVLIGKENSTNRANIEFFGGSASEIRVNQNGATGGYASIRYSRTLLGVARITAKGGDLINYSLLVESSNSANSSNRIIYIKNRNPELNDGTFADVDLRFGGNMSISNGATGANETVNKSRLIIESNLRRNLSDFNPSTAQFEVKGIGTNGWMLHINESGANVDVDSVASAVVSEYNIARINAIGIDSVNGGIGTEVVYTDASTLKIDGSPTATLNKTIITNSYALNVASGNSFFGGDVIINDNQVFKAATGGGTLNLRDGNNTVALTPDGGSYNQGWLYADEFSGWMGFGSAGDVFTNTDGAYIKSNVSDSWSGLSAGGLVIKKDSLGKSLDLDTSPIKVFANTGGVLISSNAPTDSSISIGSISTDFVSGVTGSVAIGLLGGAVKTSNTTYVNQLGFSSTPIGNIFDTIIRVAIASADRSFILPDADVDFQSALTETLTFGGGASGEVATLTVANGIITAKTLVP